MLQTNGGCRVHRALGQIARRVFGAGQIKFLSLDLNQVGFKSTIGIQPCGLIFLRCALAALIQFGHERVPRFTHARGLGKRVGQANTHAPFFIWNMRADFAVAFHNNSSGHALHAARA